VPTGRPEVVFTRLCCAGAAGCGTAKASTLRTGSLVCRGGGGAWMVEAAVPGTGLGRWADATRLTSGCATGLTGRAASSLPSAKELTARATVAAAREAATRVGLSLWFW
jgi:hypothetical protein